MSELSGNFIFDAFMTTAERFSDIARMAPTVVWLRSDALMASMAEPSTFDSRESLLMVSEKIAAMTEGMLRATMTAGAGVGSAIMTGIAQPDLAFKIADAAVEPMRRQVQANYDRLTTKAD